MTSTVPKMTQRFRSLPSVCLPGWRHDQDHPILQCFGRTLNKIRRLVKSMLRITRFCPVTQMKNIYIYINRSTVKFFAVDQHKNLMTLGGANIISWHLMDESGPLKRTFRLETKHLFGGGAWNLPSTYIHL